MVIIYHINGEEECHDKFAGFDYDWTLVIPKDGRIFPTNIDDWQWMYPEIPQIIRKYYNDGYKIVIFTNQSKEWKYEQIRYVMGLLEIPITIIIATDKGEYKPNLHLYDAFCGGDDHLYDKNVSFYVGDALGRKGDFSDSDKEFAENIGVKCFSPEDIFVGVGVGVGVGDVRDTILYPSLDFLADKSTRNVIILVGYPASGKTTIAEYICKMNDTYIHIAGDVYKTSKKMIKQSMQYSTKTNSIIFDATNANGKKRREYIDHARQYGYAVICIHLTTSLDDSYKRNKTLRSVCVPRIVYSVYKKNFEAPNMDEGFDTLLEI